MSIEDVTKEALREAVDVEYPQFTSVSTVCRYLTPIELETARVLGLVVGFDTDDELEAPVQHRHIVTGAEHGKMRPICNATTLWGYSGNTIESQDKITCPACIAQMPLYIQRAKCRVWRTVSFTGVNT